MPETFKSQGQWLNIIKTDGCFTRHALGAKSPRNLLAIRDAHLKTLEEKHIFSQVDVNPLDAARIQKLYFHTKNSTQVSVNFQRNVPLPEIIGVRESYIGLLALSEYMKMVADEHGAIRRRLFFDNVRDFQGETEVNKSIATTLNSDGSMEFPLRNNGVTIVTHKLQRVGDKFNLEDFQVVNGCQTSHVLANNWRGDLGQTFIPVKLIATEDEEITWNVVIASNSQNRIDQDSFWGLDPIHKKIEIFFESRDGDAKLYYERRPGQYNATPDVEKVRIVTKDGLLKVVRLHIFGRAEPSWTVL